MKWAKVALVSVLVIGALCVSVYLIRGCGETVRDATKDVPFIGKVVDKIQKKLPKVLQPPATLNPADKGDQHEDTRPSRFMVNPRFDVGVGMGTGMKPDRKDLIPKVGVGVSVFSYGKDKMDTKYRFARVGVQTNMKEVEITASPIMIRLGSAKHPLLSNTYIYPYVGYNVQRNSATAGIGLSISF